MLENILNLNFDYVIMEKLVYSSIFIILAILLSFKEKIGIEKELFSASIISLIQLSIMGYFLITLFSLGMTVAYFLILLMIIVASNRVTNKIKEIPKKKMFLYSFNTMLAITIISSIILTLSKTVPYEPQYIIPLIGMVVGNSLDVVTLTLDRLINNIKSNRGELWGYMALGATDLQSIKPFINKSIKSALIPQMNRTKTAGIVFIPGAMTGMIIGGADPLYAATIQIVIMWMILSGALMSALIICYISYKDVIKL